VKRYFFILFVAFFIFQSCNTEKEQLPLANKNVCFPVRVGNNWGLVDTSGNYIVKPEFEFLGDFNFGYAIVARSKRYSYINKQGKIMFPFSFLGASDFSEGKAIVLDSLNRISCIDTTFKTLFTLPDSITETGCFSEGMLPVKCKDKYAYVNASGNIVIPFSFCTAGDFKSGLAAVAVKIEIDGKDSVRYNHFYINKSGKQVISAFFKEAYSFCDGLAAVQKDSGGWNWIDKSGRYLSLNDFQECASFSEGFASFKSKDLWGMINKKGKIVVFPSYSYFSQVKQGLSVVSLGPQSFTFVDTIGKLVLRPEFKAASTFNNNYAYIVKDQRISIIDKSGKIFCNEQFDAVPGYFGVDLGFYEQSMNLHLSKIGDDELNPDKIQ
jgi:hypothetical protein